ncbi:mitogen-activated protein kinase kinase kinase 5-like isoform X2 [Salvia miltiorrhiza]|uniref:mitogen-activated protein kinase kinase kinase 5-like isoform X2 n=1 Tax=Salvia miltiorrhiza TaxID=226208 RepID=UPI0025AC7E2E|nr:mitogen-activated protein kinase kinase kinase 5-like isoform X2 [Salvia miltiorrhiza]
MHWWQLRFSSTTKSQAAGDILITGAESATAGSFSSRRKLRQNEWPSRSRSSSALAQPLPLPELVPSRCHKVPLPSPSPGKCSEERERRTAEAHGLDHHLKRLVCDNTRTSAEEAEVGLSRKSAVKQYEYAEESILMSAPTSPVSSPPPTDIYITPLAVFHARSVPEIPHSNGNTQLSYHHRMHSNKIFALRVEDKISSESISHANVHTLPLPPGADMPTPTSSTSHLSGPTTPGVKHSSPVSQLVAKPQLISQWQKGKLIGRGTFGSVYVASNRETGALCAMKEVEVLAEDVKSRESMRQLEQEIKVLSKLKHPNIVQYYGSEVVGNKFYIYLEYVHPGSINKFIHDHCAAITESVIRNFTRHILCGLAYLHSTKTIHRDIKGDNLLVDAHGVVKLADFGLAKHVDGEATNLSLKGSPYWMAPELLQPKDASADLGLAIDIWSLGCTIIQMINGKPPWSDYEGAAALFKVLKESPPIPETLSAEGKDFLQCCFRRNPADRPTAIKLLDHPFVDCSTHLHRYL